MRTNPRASLIKSIGWIAVFTVFFLADSASALDWDIEVIDNVEPLYFNGDRNLRLDAQGHPHVTYGGDRLYYAFHDGSTWHYEVADSSYQVSYYMYTTLALDGSGYPHISYYDGENNALKYAYRDGSGWHTERVEVLWVGGGLTSLALDGSGQPHISYCGGEGLDPELKYAYRDTSDWHIELTGNLYPEHPSLALDRHGYPHISHRDFDEYLKYTHRDSTGWYIETVDGTGGWTRSLALDGQDYPHISYYAYPGLKYAHRDGSGWHYETVDDESWGHTSLALDASGYPHISYDGYGDLKYAYRDGSGWHTQTVGASGESYDEYTSLALGASGCPHISYYDETNNDLKYARPTILLSGTVEAGELVLSWSEFPWASAFRVHGEANNPYFEPIPENLMAVLPSDDQSFDSGNGIGDPESNWTYLVLAVDDADQEIMRSNYCGEHDFGMEIP